MTRLLLTSSWGLDYDIIVMTHGDVTLVAMVAILGCAVHVRPPPGSTAPAPGAGGTTTVYTAVYSALDSSLLHVPVMPVFYSLL